MTAPPRKPDILAGILTFLVPGLGQLSQGRTIKGILFSTSLFGLFFYGMWLGQWQNVYLTNKESGGRPADPRSHIHLMNCLTARPHFIGQFFIGMAAWPALYQYAHYDENEVANPRFGRFEREPSDEKINELQRNDNKTWDLAWVYTVIAGVLNILVIYDAIAGPAFMVIPLVKKPDEVDDLKADQLDQHNPPVDANATADAKTIEIKREVAK